MQRCYKTVGVNQNKEDKHQQSLRPILSNHTAPMKVGRKCLEELTCRFLTAILP